MEGASSVTVFVYVTVDQQDHARFAQDHAHDYASVLRRFTPNSLSI